jgi:hypothetical protein
MTRIKSGRSSASFCARLPSKPPWSDFSAATIDQRKLRIVFVLAGVLMIIPAAADHERARGWRCRVVMRFR